MKLVILDIDEPISGKVFPGMIEECGAEEAVRRYRATVLVTMRQLKGLSEARLSLRVEPADGEEAVRFWLLPRLSDKWVMEGSVFRAEGWEIDFGGSDGAYNIRANGEICCPYLGARWVHAALLGLGRTTHSVLGPCPSGGHYFTASSDADDGSLPARILPELSILKTHQDWQEALESPLGPALKRAWEEEKT